jgi:hypothetical protein
MLIKIREVCEAESLFNNEQTRRSKTFNTKVYGWNKVKNHGSWHPVKNYQAETSCDAIYWVVAGGLLVRDWTWLPGKFKANLGYIVSW